MHYDLLIRGGLGMPVTGWPMAKIVRGRTVVRDDEVLGAPGGRLARFSA